MRQIKRFLRAMVPAPLFSLYHLFLAKLGAIAYRHPSRELLVVAVTGTKGKSSTTELVNAIFEAAGKQTALLNSIRIKIGDHSSPNEMRMSMPGRFFIQRFLRDAVRAKCDAAILEMTSEGARQHRQRGIDLDALIFTNLTPEHIESHGSLQKYADAKFQIGRQLMRSRKRPRIILANADDPESARYLALPVEKSIPFSLSSCSPHESNDHGGFFTFRGKRMEVRLPGDFSLKNAIASAVLADSLGINTETIVRGLSRLTNIPGRAERIEEGQPFAVVVDYAHTPDSLQALYDAYKTSRKICVLGSMGAGRDKWKRPLMGKIADSMCDVVILTNEDPGDEDPQVIADQLARGMTRAPTIVLDRRLAIRNALKQARAGDAVLITGKGTDPWIYGPGGSKIPWSDAQVAREELRRL